MIPKQLYHNPYAPIFSHRSLSLNVKSNFSQKDNDLSLYINPLEANSMDTVRFSGNEHLEEKGLVLATSLFREGYSLELIAQIAKNFHNNKNQPFRIADYACSTGDETYSLGMLLKGINYTMIGYDLAENALSTAQSGIVGINHPDKFVEAREKQHFDSINEKFGPQKGKQILDNRLQSVQFLDSYLDKPSASIPSEFDKTYHNLFHQYFKKQENSSQPERTLYKKRSNTDLQCNFALANIQDIQKTRGKNSTDVILFRNALYHLITEPLNPGDVYNQQRKPLPADQVNALLDNLFQQFHNVLSQDGFLVMGCQEAEQHQQRTLVEAALRRAGFVARNPLLPIYQKATSKKQFPF